MRMPSSLDDPKKSDVSFDYNSAIHQEYSRTFLVREEMQSHHHLFRDFILRTMNLPEEEIDILRLKLDATKTYLSHYFPKIESPQLQKTVEATLKHVEINNVSHVQISSTEVKNFLEDAARGLIETRAIKESQKLLQSTPDENDIIITQPVTS